MELRKFVVYLAGKITGDPGYREKFAWYEALLQRFSGIAVLNPAHAPQGLRPADYMRLAFAQIETADVVCFLPDWGHSAGTSLEMQYCRYIGKRWMQFPPSMEGFDFWMALARADAEHGARDCWTEKHRAHRAPDTDGTELQPDGSAERIRDPALINAAVDFWRN